MCEGLGSPNSDDWRDSLVLCLLYSVPLLIVETEVNSTQRGKMKGLGSILGWLVGLVVPVLEIFVLPWLL
jgi:hypothetical protein